MNIFASCSSYVLGSLFGPVRACEMITEAVKHPSRPPPCFAVKALHALTHLGEVTLRIDGGGSHIGKSRSRHLYDAIQSKADVWVTIDDDVSATRETLAWMLTAVEDSEARVCIAPCMLRGTGEVNVEWSPVYYERTLLPGGSARRAIAGGFGLVAMNRKAMLAAAIASPMWEDPHDGKMKPAAFLESLDDHHSWVGEDIAFFRRLPRTVEVLALTSGKTIHAGHELALDALKT